MLAKEQSLWNRMLQAEYTKRDLTYIVDCLVALELSDIPETLEVHQLQIIEVEPEIGVLLEAFKSVHKILVALLTVSTNSKLYNPNKCGFLSV
jgi:hypothetical protein